MPIPFRTGDHVTMVFQRDDDPDQDKWIPTVVRGFSDTHCWLEHEDAAGLVFDRLTGALHPKIKGEYCAIHTTNQYEGD